MTSGWAGLETMTCFSYAWPVVSKTDWSTYSRGTFDRMSLVRSTRPQPSSLLGVGRVSTESSMSTAELMSAALTRAGDGVPLA